MTLSPLRPIQVVERQIDAAERELTGLIGMNPQFSLRFFNLFLIIQDWKHAKSLIELADEPEDQHPLAFARIAGRKETADELAEIRDAIVENEKESDDVS